MSGEDHPEQEREQGGGCWSLPEILKDSQLAARCGVCQLGRARGSRRAWFSAGGGAASCGGQENQFGLKPYPSSCVLLGAHLRPPCAWQGKECLPRMCGDEMLGVQVSLCILSYVPIGL